MPGEQNDAPTLRYHLAGRRLPDQEAAEGCHRNCTFHIARIQIDQRTADAPARVVNHQLRFAQLAANLLEQRGHALCISCIADKRTRTSFLFEGAKLLDGSCGERDVMTLASEAACKRCAQARTGANYQRGGLCHVLGFALVSTRMEKRVGAS